MKVLIFVLAALPGFSLAAPIYKCIDGAGRTQFTDQPCPATSAAEIISQPTEATVDPQFFGPAIDQTAAANQCEQAARRRANNPSTVNFSRFWSAAFQSFPDGRATYISQFKAKNGFGLELNFDIACYFKGDRLDRVAVNEAS